MARISMQSSGKRPRFFPEPGADEAMSMMLELMSELWTMRERMYALERVAARSGLELTAGIEAWQPNEDEARELAEGRRQMIESVLRSFEANHVPGLHLRRSLDRASESEDDDGSKHAEVIRAA